MKKVLIVGGSGHVSGAVARKCLEYGFNVTIITRGTRPVPSGVTAWQADRNDAPGLRQLLNTDHAQAEFDAVFDCICYHREAMRLILELLGVRTAQLLFISTDWVYDRSRRQFPQPVDSPCLTDDRNGAEAYGFNKRQAELELIEHAPAGLNYNIFRPCHIYGMPSELGCFPGHCRDRELIARLLAGQPVELVDNGRLLQQPIDVEDLAETMVSAVGAHKAGRKIFNMAGPDIVESRTYYEIIARALKVPLNTKSLNFDDYAAQHPAQLPFLCHRVYRQDDLRAAGVRVPSTALADGLTRHTLAKRRQLGL